MPRRLNHIECNEKIDEHKSFQVIINAIESYIQLMTSRKANALDDALSGLEGLESDLCGIISDVKEVVEGRV